MDFLKGAGLCTGFIASFYVWPRDFRFLTTAVRDLASAALDDSVYVDRNSDSTIARRCVSFTVVTALSLLFMRHERLSLGACGNEPSSTTSDGRQVITAILSVLALFSGHIIEDGHTLLGELPSTRSSSLRFFRDVVLAPVGEEIFFRGALFTVFQNRSEPQRICLSAILFSASHLHHVVSWAADACRWHCCERTRSDSDSSTTDACTPTSTSNRGRSCDAKTVKASWCEAWRRTGKVAVITAIFGLFSGYYYSHACKGNIVAISAVHSLCNFLGPPAFVCFRETRDVSNQLSTPRRIAAAVGYVAGFIVWISAISRK